MVLTSTGFGGTEENPTTSGVQEMTLSRPNALEATGSAGWMMPR
ncbi:hypothetical protein [Corallococcus sp. CA053C]|nr:hypothetical protein [Corallococcus sp. CA053C]